MIHTIIFIQILTSKKYLTEKETHHTSYILHKKTYIKKTMRILKIIPLLLWGIYANAQEAATPISKWRGNVAVGQYEAIIGFPKFSPVRIGGNVGASYHLNKSNTHQLRQAFQLGGFYHQDLQTAVQLYTEFQYEWHFRQFYLMPLAIGGGYTASFPDMTSFSWDGTKYVQVPTAMRHNFLVSLGPTISYETPLKIANKPLSFTVAYRMQVQGIIVQNTVPIMAYSSLQLGAAIPF